MDDVVELKMDESAGELPPNPGSASCVASPEPSKESIAAESDAIIDDNEAKNTISMVQATSNVELVEELQHCCPKEEPADEVHSETGPLLYVPPTELSKESIAADSNTIMKDGKANQATCVVKQLVDEWKHCCPKDESAGEVHSEPGSLLYVPPADLSKENIVAELKAIMDDADSKNIISMGKATYGWHLVEELQRRGSEDEPSEVTTSPSVKAELDADKVESATSNGQVTNTLHLVEERHQQNAETGLSNKVCELNAKPISEHDDAEVSKSSILVAETELQVGTVIGRKELMVVEEAKIAEELHKQMVDSEAQEHGKTNLKLTLDKKRTEIAEELESLKAQMDQKLKKIDEIAKQEAVIDTEIAHLESQCSECKRKHDEFIELFKLVVESQLPLRTHREIVLLMNKEDKAAQKFLSKAMELQIQIGAQAKLKLTLQEERSQFAKLVEALKVQQDEKLKEADEVNELEEAADSEITPHIVPLHTLVYSRSCRKRKTRNRQLAEEELCSPRVQAKRTDLKTVDSSLQQMVTDP